MNDNHETIKDIRKDAEARFREMVEAWMQRRSAFQTTVGAMQAFNTLFDRIEAAHEREVASALAEKPTTRVDPAAQRDALVETRQFLETAIIDGRVTADAIFRLSNVVSAALSALSAPATTERSSAVGDCAKLREALKEIDRIVWDKSRHTKEEVEAHRLVTETLTALAAPVPTAEKSSVVGNAAKLREACAKAAESAAEIMERVRHKDGLAFNTANYIVGVAKDALAAPPRNCERFNTGNAAVDLVAAIKHFASETGTPVSGISPGINCAGDFALWLLSDNQDVKENTAP